MYIHFTHVKYKALGILIDQAHLPDDVIDNIESTDPLYYQKRTLMCVVTETSPLCKEYELREDFGNQLKILVMYIFSCILWTTFIQCC